MTSNDQNNPLKLAPPDDPIERIHAMARDLAYGVAQGIWDTQLDWWRWGAPEVHSLNADVFSDYIFPKWERNYPSAWALHSFGYVTVNAENYVVLTEKAFKLLEKPLTAPSIFVSYRRSDSSAFALLVEARLKLVGNPNPFVDKNLIPGEQWNTQLQKQIASCRYFIVLVGQTTLGSPNVLDEIRWATESGATIISIWHDGAKLHSAANAPEVLRQRHAIEVASETALGYETAVNQLLNALGYATY